MHLHAVDLETGPGEELLVTNVALEVLGLLVLQKDLVVLEFSVTIRAKHKKRHTPTTWSQGIKGSMNR